MIIAIGSCWNYRDAVPPCFALFRKFWPDCPYPIYLLTDRRVDPVEGVEQFVVDAHWGRIVSAFAEQQTTEILFLLEDFFFFAPVQPEAVREALEIMQSRPDAMACRLFPYPGANTSVPWSHGFGLVDRYAPYRICTQAAVWNRHVLADLAGRFTNPWDFEIHGTQLAQADARDVYSWKADVQPWPMQTLHTGITRGKWERFTQVLCDREGVAVDWSMRPFVDS
jgi:hypothetical protein